ncbi:family 43 glycosylhydrolase [Salsuginibacillus kocurii]|uniref:glycoside hydrolase family 43 protein n=1 Tax=Salsuginibacillus kocurii TaxID=427078 RepID=UPI00036DEF54|nr:family 43 glycosylhydrolase [Salsuginibacillus kocurii]
MTLIHEFKNPLIEQRADPWIYLHNDGFYYFTGSVPSFNEIEVRRSTTLEGLREAEPVSVWKRPEEGPLSGYIWAPEIHYIDGKWYIHFAASEKTLEDEGEFDHRMYVLECESQNPLEGKWEEKGKINTKWESFSLDATTFAYNGKRYLVWAQKDSSIPGNSNVYLSEMENPWTLKGDTILLTSPEYEWEKIGFLVNEGPAVLIRDNNIFITYSASATDYNYCMGLLWADGDSDLLSASSWSKAEKPVFVSSEKNGQYGPGHNSFTRTKDGEDVLVYHARNYKEIEGNPLKDPNRHTRVKTFTWDEKGFPVFGEPL